ncbi:MAG: enoyl-CoA hydratase/isomerase family protein [bacterium]
MNSFKEAELDDSINVVVLKGNGDKAFCAGADLKELKNSIDKGIDYVRKYFDLYVNLIKTTYKDY